MSPPSMDRPHGSDSATEPWPSLPLDAWRETYATLHMMTQVVGKIRLAHVPMVNHWWQVTFQVTARGLSAGSMPHGSRTFEMDFDLVDHALRMQVSDGAERSIPLRSRPIAEFYGETMEALAEIGVPVRIWTRPVEVENPIPFDQDFEHTTYVPEHAQRCWHALRQADRVLSEFRSGFVGKCSPVHFFWGGFDLAVTRFSGRRAPEHPGGVPNLADRVVREAYSRECSSCGFWPGGGAIAEPAFFAYTYPEPDGYREHPIRPAEAYYSDEMREHILPYDAVRRADDPDRMLLDFLRTTYEAGAELGGWDRRELESDDPAPGRVAPEPAPTFPRHGDES